MANVYLLTGNPGAGKTTLIRQAVARLKVKTGGFYTQEIRVGGIRQGFKITTITGREAILSYVDISSPHRVSKYCVDVDSLDRVGVAAIHHAITECAVIIIDEIGKMELFSPRFREAVLKAMESGKKVLGTIMLNPSPFADQIKKHPQVRLIRVSRANHDQVFTEIMRWLQQGDDENNP